MAGQPKRGAIRSEQAYAQGKMLDHSAWADVLPRGITPSDIDACFDNNGQIIYCEFSSQAKYWKDVSAGQRRLYRAAIKGNGAIAAVCKHSVPSSKAIDTKNDIESFSVMMEADGALLITKTLTGWPDFIEGWYANPLKVRQRLLELVG